MGLLRRPLAVKLLLDCTASLATFAECVPLWCQSFLPFLPHLPAQHAGTLPA